MLTKLDDISYPLQTGKWVASIIYIFEYGYKTKIKPFAWHHKYFDSKKTAREYALKAGYIFAKKTFN